MSRIPAQRSRVVRVLVRLYPRAWRARYADEFVALLDQTGLSWTRVVDIVRSAAIERARAAAAAIFGHTGSARYTRLILGRGLLPFAAAWSIATMGWIIGTLIDGTPAAITLHESPFNFLRFFLPVLAIARYVAFVGVKDRFLRQRLVIGRFEAAIWFGLAFASSVLLRLDTLNYHRSPSFGPDLWMLDWSWVFSPAQLLLVALYVLMATPRARHATALAKRIQARRRRRSLPTARVLGINN